MPRAVPLSSGRSPRLCNLCRNHGEESAWGNGHGRVCPHRQCVCEACQRTMARRKESATRLSMQRTLSMPEQEMRGEREGRTCVRCRRHGLPGVPVPWDGAGVLHLCVYANCTCGCGRSPGRAQANQTLEQANQDPVEAGAQVRLQHPADRKEINQVNSCDIDHNSNVLGVTADKPLVESPAQDKPGVVVFVHEDSPPGLDSGEEDQGHDDEDPEDNFRLVIDLDEDGEEPPEAAKEVDGEVEKQSAPAEASKGVVRQCGFCRNHDAAVPVRGHKCPYRYACLCEACSRRARSLPGSKNGGPLSSPRRAAAALASVAPAPAVEDAPRTPKPRGRPKGGRGSGRGVKRSRTSSLASTSDRCDSEDDVPLMYRQMGRGIFIRLSPAPAESPPNESRADGLSMQEIEDYVATENDPLAGDEIDIGEVVMAAVHFMTPPRDAVVQAFLPQDETNNVEIEPVKSTTPEVSQPEKYSSPKVAEPEKLRTPEADGVPAESASMTLPPAPDSPRQTVPQGPPSSPATAPASSGGPDPFDVQLENSKTPEAECVTLESSPAEPQTDLCTVEPMPEQALEPKADLSIDEQIREEAVEPVADLLSATEPTLMESLQLPPVEPEADLSANKPVMEQLVEPEADSLSINEPTPTEPDAEAVPIQKKLGKPTIEVIPLSADTSEPPRKKLALESEGLSQQRPAGPSEGAARVVAVPLKRLISTTVRVRETLAGLRVAQGNPASPVPAASSPLRVLLPKSSPRMAQGNPASPVPAASSPLRVLLPKSSPRMVLPSFSTLTSSATTLSESALPKASSLPAVFAQTSTSWSSASSPTELPSSRTSSSLSATATVRTAPMPFAFATQLSSVTAGSSPKAPASTASSAPPRSRPAEAEDSKPFSPTAPLDLSAATPAPVPAPAPAARDLSLRQEAPAAAQQEPDLPELADLEDELGTVTAPATAAARGAAAAAGKKNLSESITPLSRVAQVAPRQPMGPPPPWRPKLSAPQAAQAAFLALQRATQRQQMPQVPQVQLVQEAPRRPSPSSSPASPWEPVVGVREGTWGETLHNCGDCGLALDTVQDRAHHRLQHHVTGQRRACGQCSQVSFSHTQDQLHAALMHPSPVLEEFRCPDCAACFPSATMLSTHLMTTRDELHGDYAARGGVIQCPVCHLQAMSPSSLAKHVRTAHINMTPFQCDELGCGVSYDSPLELQRHRRGHIRENSQQRCPACCLPFVTRELLEIHWSQQHPAPSFVCPLCNKGFTAAAGLTGHVRRGHPGTRPFMCREPGCGRSFTCLTGLHEHTSESRHMSLTSAKRHRVSPAHLQAPPPPPAQQQGQQGQHPTSRTRGCSCAGCPNSFPDSWSLSDHQDSAHMGLVPIAQVAHLLSLAKDAALLKAAANEQRSQSQAAAYHSAMSSVPVRGGFGASFVPGPATAFPAISTYPPAYGSNPAPYPPSSGSFHLASSSFPQSFIRPSVSSSSSFPSAPTSLPHTTSYPYNHPAYPAPPPYQPPAPMQRSQQPYHSEYYNPNDYA